MDVKRVKENLTLDTIASTKEYEDISILGQSIINKDIIDFLKSCGVNYISTRTIGFDHIDVSYAKKIGFRVSKSYYEPNGVARLYGDVNTYEFAPL